MLLMETKTLHAHFDGERILLDEPYELEPNAELIVTVLPKALDEERGNWAQLSLESLSRAYGDEEPDYPNTSIKEVNPEYDGR